MRRVIDAPSTYIQGPGEIKKLAEHYRSIGEVATAINQAWEGGDK